MCYNSIVLFYNLENSLNETFFRSHFSLAYFLSGLRYYLLPIALSSRLKHPSLEEVNAIYKSLQLLKLGFTRSLPKVVKIVRNSGSRTVSHCLNSLKITERNFCEWQSLGCGDTDSCEAFMFQLRILHVYSNTNNSLIC